MKPVPFFVMLSGIMLSMAMLPGFYDYIPFQNNTSQQMVQKDSVLRHVVLFRFKAGTTPEQISNVESAFSALPSKIKEIKTYEWGLNNSPEGLDKGFTHCFLLTFESEVDRAVYLPHPEHKAFGVLLKPYLEDVLVLDYWSK